MREYLLNNERLYVGFKCMAFFGLLSLSFLGCSILVLALMRRKVRGNEKANLPF